MTRTSNEITSQSGSYEQVTISLFDGSAGRTKRHYEWLKYPAKVEG
jgi:hypothetical protein